LEGEFSPARRLFGVPSSTPHLAGGAAMFRCLIFALAMALGTAVAVPADAQMTKGELETRRKQLQADHARRVAEMRTKAGLSTPSHRAAAGVTPSPFSPATAANRNPAWNAPPLSGTRLPHPVKQQVTPPFNLALAPPPADCLWKYVAAAASASTMEQILPYLPDREARSLQEYQATYDPQQALESRKSLQQLNPKITEEELTYLTNPPYVNALARHQRRAEKILEVLSIQIDGDKASLSVSTTNGAIVNGGRYPYGTATIELVGEGNTWKIGAYNDGNVFYQEPPKPKTKSPAQGK
jgi:hypothetical protein